TGSPARTTSPSEAGRAAWGRPRRRAPPPSSEILVPMISPTPQAQARRPTAADGFVVVDKPQGWTSHDVVGRVRRLAGTRKVGHAGTLDTMATGVLVLGVGKAPRRLTYVVGADKDYDATIRHGVATTTDDAEGAVAAVADPAAIGSV